jgi:hypothetical protein
MQPAILIWDNDGTIMGSLNPHDTAPESKTILPILSAARIHEASVDQ